MNYDLGLISISCAYLNFDCVHLYLKVKLRLNALTEQHNNIVFFCNLTKKMRMIHGNDIKNKFIR